MALPLAAFFGVHSVSRFQASQIQRKRGRTLKHIPNEAQLDVELKGLRSALSRRTHHKDITDHLRKANRYRQPVVKVARVVVDLGQSHDVRKNCPHLWLPML